MHLSYPYQYFNGTLESEPVENQELWSEVGHTSRRGSACRGDTKDSTLRKILNTKLHFWYTGFFGELSDLHPP